MKEKRKKKGKRKRCQSLIRKKCQSTSNNITMIHKKTQHHSHSTIKQQTLISLSEIQELVVDKGLCIIGNEKPFLFESSPYYLQGKKIK